MKRPRHTKRRKAAERSASSSSASEAVRTDFMTTLPAVPKKARETVMPWLRRALATAKRLAQAWRPGARRRSRARARFRGDFSGSSRALWTSDIHFEPDRAASGCNAPGRPRKGERACRGARQAPGQEKKARRRDLALRPDPRRAQGKRSGLRDPDRRQAGRAVFPLRGRTRARLLAPVSPGASSQSSRRHIVGAVALCAIRDPGPQGRARVSPLGPGRGRRLAPVRRRGAGKVRLELRDGRRHTRAARAIGSPIRPRAEEAARPRRAARGGLAEEPRRRGARALGGLSGVGGGAAGLSGGFWVRAFRGASRGRLV